MTKTKINDIDNYIAGFPKSTQDILMQLRAAIQKAAPKAEEMISYQMPAFNYHGILVYFAAYKNHIGFYPTASGIEAFKKELSAYKGSKGAVQFPIDKPLPFNLVSKIVKFRIKENLKKAEAKKSLRTCSKGHKYYKSSDCPTCPTCEHDRKPQNGFFSLLSAPARRALENKGITTLKQLSKLNETEILELHGMGESTIPKLRKALAAEGLSFRKIKDLSKNEIMNIKNDIKVFYVTATSFPDGILEAHKKLHSLVPFSTDRKYFGISRPEMGKIIYKAAAEEINPGEAEKFNCETFILPKGKYIYIVIKDYNKGPQNIGKVFKKLLTNSKINPNGYCIEWYLNDRDVQCMVKLK